MAFSNTKRYPVTNMVSWTRATIDVTAYDERLEQAKISELSLLQRFNTFQRMAFAYMGLEMVFVQVAMTQ